MGMVRATAAILLACGFSLGAEVSSRDFYGAIRNNDLPKLREIFDAGTPADLRDARGSTPLMHAASIGSVDAMKILLKARAGDPKTSDGSWRVASRAPKIQPYFRSGFPHDHDQWISFSATAWAAAALAEAGAVTPDVASLR